jgi:hypothetical protein
MVPACGRVTGLTLSVAAHVAVGAFGTGGMVAVTGVIAVGATKGSDSGSSNEMTILFAGVPNDGD